jgi:hypothetical protein
MYDICGEQVASRIKKGWQNKCNRFKHMHKLDSELYPYFSDYANVSISRYYQVGLFIHATCSEHTIKSYDPVPLQPPTTLYSITPTPALNPGPPNQRYPASTD